MNLQNTQTLKNLMQAFAGESMARNRYCFAAEQAETDGLPVIAAVFRYTADQEKEHAEIFANYLRKGGNQNVEVSGGFPVDTGADTLSLLADSGIRVSSGFKWICNHIFSDFGHVLYV